MLHLVTGGSGSGKSAYAEDWLKNKTHKKPMLYIASMEPFGEEAHKRILRHQQMRKNKGFCTMECYRDLENCQIPKTSGILLECMSNLAANEFFLTDGTWKSQKEVKEKILKGIRHLEKSCDTLVIVTNEVTADGVTYDAGTFAYQKLLGELNQWLAFRADKVTEVVYGIPVVVK